MKKFDNNQYSYVCDKCGRVAGSNNDEETAKMIAMKTTRMYNWRTRDEEMICSGCMAGEKLEVNNLYVQR